MSEDERADAGNRFTMPMGRWRLFLLAEILGLVALPLAGSIHYSAPVWAIVLEACVLMGCALAGWLLIAYSDRLFKRVSESAVGLCFLVPAVVGAIAMGLVMQVQYAGEAVMLYIGFAALRGTRPERVRLLPATPKEWIPVILLFLFSALMVALYWQMEAISQWLIRRYLMGSLRGD